MQGYILRVHGHFIEEANEKLTEMLQDGWEIVGISACDIWTVIVLVKN